ncbi:MAG: YHS domain-containing protein [Zestosphaera sp.]
MGLIIDPVNGMKADPSKTNYKIIYTRNYTSVASSVKRKLDGNPGYCLEHGLKGM